MGLNMSKHAYLHGHVTRGGGGSRFVYVTGLPNVGEFYTRGASHIALFMEVSL